IVILLISVMILQPVEVNAFKAGAHAVLTVDVAKALPQASIIRQAMLKYPNIAAWGATGPDIPANTFEIVLDRAPWFERYHYEKVGSFVGEQLKLALASGDERKIAWAAGWVTHVVGDLYCHGVFVNPDPEVNGVYLDDPDTKAMHGKLEAYADKVLYQDMSESHAGYTPANMQSTFASFDTDGVIGLARQASFNTYGMAPSITDYRDWMDFFKDIYLDTGVAGADNWVYSYSYKEAADALSGGKIPDYQEFGGMTRMQRLNRAYTDAKTFSAALLQDAERGIYDGFSDAWNLDAYHKDGRSIGTLTVNVRTADVQNAGTDDDLFFGMILEDGTKWERILDKTLYNDLESGDNDDYYLFVSSHNFPIRSIKKVYLRKESDGLAGGWKCASLRATVNGKALYDGDVNTWLEDDHLMWTADAMNTIPQRINVALTGTASAYTDKISGTALISGAPYVGEVSINIKKENDSTENYSVNTDGQGGFSYSIPLNPKDYITLNIYKPHETINLCNYVGSISLGYASVPFENITLSADAFNDSIKGEVSGGYTGALDIVLERSSASRTITANAANGLFSLNTELIGGDRIYPRLMYEGTAFPRERITYSPTLNALEMKYISDSDGISGTITNTAGRTAKAYTGDVKLTNLMSGALIQTQKAVQVSGTTGITKGLRLREANTSTSNYSFKGVADQVKLGFTISIEHDGLLRSLSYDPTASINSGTEQTTNNPIVSIQERIIDSRINPAAGISTAAGSVMTPAANLNINPQAASGSSNIMLSPTAPAAPPSIKGLWTTEFGSMLIYEEQNMMIKGVYGDGDYTLEGKLEGNAYKGTFIEGNVRGEFEFVMNSDGKGFTGKRRINGDTSWVSWNGK
ncbi:MAG TPA: zinc dependent phospholipase C family protein, partial [Negativicutes bacterium]|nr:zinc dependent phospholipase C family protein [Negativicutes bacterium]